MPNHVYTTLTLADEKYAPKIKEAIKLNGGLAEYVMPMPKEIRGSVSPTIIVSDEDKLKASDDVQKITQAEHDRLVMEYGADNWYDWACDKWGTKWGTYDHDWDEETMVLRFMTAWSMLSEDVLTLLAKNLGDFDMRCEEESGEFDITLSARDGKIG